MDLRCWILFLRSGLKAQFTSARWQRLGDVVEGIFDISALKGQLKIKLPLQGASISLFLLNSYPRRCRWAEVSCHSVAV